MDIPPEITVLIPIFTSQLEKSREATDMANIRAAYAEVTSSALSEEATSGVTDSNGVYSKTVKLTQAKDGWQTTVDLPQNLKPTTGATQPTAGQEVTISSTETGATINILIVKQ